MSRDLPDLRKLLQEYPEIEVRLDRDDILRYVDWRLCEEGEVQYDLLEGHLKEAIASKLFEHADGSFLLVRLSMDHISCLTTVKKIRKSLEALPSDYQEAYQRTFDRVLKQNSGRRELALKALTWISSAKRSLTMRELQYAVAAEDNESTVGDEDLESPKSILSSCLGLVRLSRTEQKVEFIHSSARTFTQTRVDPDADKTITRACLRYMSTIELASGPSLSFKDFTRRLQSLPFLEYAARFYGYHVRSVEQSVLTELRRFLEDEKLRGSSWQVLQFIYSPHHTLGQEIFAGLPCRISVLHVASFWGFSHLLTTVLKDSGTLSANDLADINVMDSQGWTPLHWAASMGHTDSARVLLCSGAAVDSLDSAQWTPLFWAAIKGHREIADLLLSRGANIYQVDSGGMTPVHWSLSAGQDATTHLFLQTIEKGKARQPNKIYTLRYLDNRECLSISEAKRIVAPYTTSKSMVQLSADSLDATCFSKVIRSIERMAEKARFYYALGAKDVPSIEPLFRTLWRVKNKSDWGFWLSRRRDDPIATFRAKLLERAIQGEHLSLVKALLDLDEDSRQDVAGTITYNGVNYLHRACTRRNPEIALAFIAKGADVNQPDESGRTPLHHACRRGSIDVVNALLTVGRIDIQAETDDQDTPLITLLREGGWRTEHRPGENLAICNALIKHGASIYDVDRNGNTTAYIAIRLWDSEVINFFLNLGVGFSNTKADGMTPLHLAAKTPFKVAIRDSYWDRDMCDEADGYQIPSSTIENSLDLIIGFSDTAALNLVDSNSGCYEETALPLAIDSENWTVSCRLHDLGARFKTNRPLYPLLVKATRAGIPELVQLLIQNGADVNPPQKEPTVGIEHNAEILICEAARLAKCRDREQHNEDLPDPATPNYLASGDYLATIQVLIGAGFGAEGVDHNGMNALEYAIISAGSTQILHALLDAGLNPYAPGRKGFDHIRLALLNGTPNAMLCLWQHSKAYPAPASHWLYQFHSTTDFDEQENLIHIFVTALRQACIIDARDEDGHTLLFNAAMGGNQALAQELILSGANVNCTDTVGWTPLHAAISQKDAGMTGVLLQAGADIGGTLTDEISWNADRANGRHLKGSNNLHLKALHLALMAPSAWEPWTSWKPPSAELVRLLLNNGADPREEAVIGFDYNGKMQTSAPIKQLFDQIDWWINANGIKNMLEIAEMLVQGGAVVGDVALELTVEHVALFDGHEELWETLRNGMKSSQDSDDR
ncbi:ankyrin repeat-containing domain protein [Xylariaceae sp. FL1651]|nr:ankyrin repeat-containing domain protein [Xylariaceae sp. FL1651]